MRRFTMFLAGAVVWACAGPMAADAQSISFGGRERTYQLYVPARVATSGAPAPLMIVLHGGGGSGERVRAHFGMDRIAAREGIIVAYPDAVGGHWSDGRRAAPGLGNDDVGFLLELVRMLQAQGRVARGQVAVGGLSNGGLMAYRMACETSGVFSAYFALIANMPVGADKSCQPKERAAMLILAGTADTIMPYAGGKVMGPVGGRVQSAEATYAFWGGANGCSGPGSPVQLPDADSSDGSVIEVRRAQNCAPGAETSFYRVVGGGHAVPTLNRLGLGVIQRVVGAINHDIDTAEHVYAFVSGAGR